jgi:hypothetical protein
MIDKVKDLISKKIEDREIKLVQGPKPLSLFGVEDLNMLGYAYLTSVQMLSLLKELLWEIKELERVEAEKGTNF